MKYFISKPDNFNFKNTVYSHGWSELAPFVLDEEIWELSYVFDRNDGRKPIPAVISETTKKLRIEIPGRKVIKKVSDGILGDVKHILRFDEDLSEFYKVANTEKEFRWMSKKGTGRLIRSPNVFEDLVKTICTTNCSWALTKNMVNNLVGLLGEKSSNGVRAFPSPEAMASKNEKFYREKIRAGYRSPYFVELANAVAKGDLNPEEWLNSELLTADIKKEMKSVKGVGDYAAENLLKLIGRYDGLALDSWLRSEFYKRHNDGKKCPDKNIERFYKKFGEWKGMAMWFDMSRRWLD